jgi:hypothetical protein
VGLRRGKGDPAALSLDMSGQPAMLPDDAFLRRLPNIVNPPEVVYIEALVFSADTVEMSLAAIRRITIQQDKNICEAPRIVRTELFTHGWAIINSLHVVLQVLHVLQYKTPLANAFVAKYRDAHTLRNKMHHISQNAKNTVNAKGRPPLFGVISYVHVPPEFITEREGAIAVLGGGTVMLSAGRLPGGAAMDLVNPAGERLNVPVGGLRLQAFDKTIVLEAAAEDLGALMVEINSNFEKRIHQHAADILKDHGIPLAKSLGHPPSGLSVYLAFQFNN